MQPLSPLSLPRAATRTFRALTFLALATLWATATLAQPFQVDDLRTQNHQQTARPYLLGEFNGDFYFYGLTGDQGFALWRTDGTLGGAEMVDDLTPGRSAPLAIENAFNGLPHNGRLYFVFGESVSGYELWSTDGTPGTASLVSDSPAGFDFIDEPKGFVIASIGSQLFFVGADSAHGEELWVTDGTPGGTTLVKDLRPGTSGLSSPQRGVELGGKLIFRTRALGNSLIVSDGTEAGTEVLTDQIPTTFNSTPEEIGLAVLGSHVYFANSDSTHGFELWRTDGTVAGTQLFVDVLPGSASSRPEYLMSDGTHLYFQADGELWRSDGTVAGTQLFVDLNGTDDSDPRYFRKMPNGELLFFATTDSDGEELWATDGTVAGTRLVKLLIAGIDDRLIDSPLRIGNQIFFIAESNSSTLKQVFVSDGTNAGTFELDPSMDGRPPIFSALTGLREFDGKAMFTAAETSSRYELWTSDGTLGGTQAITDLTADFGSDPQEAVVEGENLFWRAIDDSTNLGLFTAQGAGGAATLLAGGQGQQAGVRLPRFPTPAGDKVFFSATTESGDGHEVYVTDGTQAGTSRLSDFPGDTEITALGHANGKVFVTLVEPGPDKQAWVTDGSPAGTFQLTSLNFRSDAYEYTQVGNTSRVVFTGENNRVDEPYGSDGTVAGTEPLSPSGSRINDPGQYTRAMGKVFFVGADNRNATIHVTDGTPAGTSNLQPSIPFNNSPYPEQLTPGPSMSLVFFTGNDNSVGRELWRTDGTVAGTFLISDLWAGPQDAEIKMLGEYLGKMWFIAFDGTTANLYSTDGTTAGTASVATLDRLAHDAVLGVGRVFDGLLYFSGFDTAGGVELWSTDGTAVGTGPVADLNPGAFASNPQELRVAGDFLAFHASSGADREMWMLPASDWIFGDGLETLDTSRWGAVLEFGAEVLANANAASLGKGGLEVVVDADNDKGSVADLSPDDERTYRMSFFFDPNGMVFPENKRLKIVSTRMADNKRHIEATLRWRAATGYQLRVKTHHENLSDWFGTFWYEVDPDGSQVTIEWQQASAPGVADGVLKLRIDGVLVETVTGIINGDLPGTDWVQLGVVGGVTPGISGSHFFDDFRSWSSLLP